MPQPIDPSTELTRLSAAQRVQELADRAQLATQHRQAQAVQENRLTAETRVQQSDQGEEKAGISDRQESRQDEQRRHGQRKPEAEEAAQQKRNAKDLQVIPDAEDAHRLDVTI